MGDASCPGFEGAIVAITKRLDPAVDVVVSGHTHDTYVCRIEGRLVTSAGSYGREATVIDLTLERASRDVIASGAQTVVIEPGRFPADEEIAASVRRTVARAAHTAQRLVGTVEGEFTPVTSAAGESNLGDLVADAQLAAMRESAGAQVALMNPGGLRAPLASQRADGAVTFADAYSVQPFGNTLVAMTLTGAQLLRVLEHQWREGAGERARLLQVSGLRYAWDGSKPIGQRVVRDSVRVDGQALTVDGRYRVAMNSFLAGGGDGFTVFTEGEETTGGPLDVVALENHLRAAPRRARPPDGRIERVDKPR